MEIRTLAPHDCALVREMLSMFAAACEDAATYAANQPDDAYLSRLLANHDFICLAALVYGQVVGGLIAYQLHKLEQARSELYIYDLAVDASFRRQGIATALIQTLQQAAQNRGAQLIYVQADREDEPAIALYSQLGKPRAVLHFDIDKDRLPR